MSDSRAQPHSEEAALRAERGRLSQELVGLYEGGGCLQGLEDLAGLLEDGAGFAGPAELGEAAALAEQGERLLGNNPEGLAVPSCAGSSSPRGTNSSISSSGHRKNDPSEGMESRSQFLRAIRDNLRLLV